MVSAMKAIINYHFFVSFAVLTVLACASPENKEPTELSVRGKMLVRDNAFGREQENNDVNFHAIGTQKHFSRSKQQLNQILSTESPLTAATISLIGNGEIITSTITDQNGEFVMVNVPARQYSIRVSHQSIETAIINGVTVISGDTTVIHGYFSSSSSAVQVDFEAVDCSIIANNSTQIAAATQIAHAAGVPLEKVISIRKGKCLGWNKVANRLNVSPRVLGIGGIAISGGRSKLSSKSNHATKLISPVMA